MKNKCVSAEAKKFENKLNEVGISYNEFVDLRKSWDELTIGGKAEVEDMLHEKGKQSIPESDKTLKDILVISKGWYNKKLYHNPLEAFNAYYHKYYGCEGITMDKAFAEYLFLRPLALKAIEIKPVLARYIFEPTYSVIGNNELFSEIMYDRLMGLIQMIKKGIFDLSEYEEIFKKAKECNYEDESIGII